MVPDMSDWDADDPQLDVAWWETRGKHFPGSCKKELQDFLVALRIYNADPMPETRRTFGVCADRLLLSLVDHPKVTIGYMITSASALAQKIGDRIDKQTNTKKGVGNTRRAVETIRARVCGGSFVPASAVVYGDRVPPRYEV